MLAAMPDPQIKAFQALVAAGALSADKLAQAHEASTRERSLAQVLQDEHGVSRAHVIEALTKHYRAEFFGYTPGATPLKDARLDWETHWMRFRQLAPLAWEGDRLVVAMVDPKNTNRRDDVSLELAAHVPEANGRPLVKVTTLEDLHQLLGSG